MLAKRLPIGAEAKGLSRTLTEGEFAMLTDLTWVTGTTHVDKEFMKNTPFGERILGGQIVLAVVTGLNSRGGLGQWPEKNGLAGGTIVGFENVRFSNPVLPGDTLQAYAQLVDARDTRDGKRCILKWREWATNQRGQHIVEATRVALYDIAGRGQAPRS